MIVNNGSLLCVDWISKGQGSTKEVASLSDDGGMKSYPTLLEMCDTEFVSNYSFQPDDCDALRWSC
jgi:hypothetical protein